MKKVKEDKPLANITIDCLTHQAVPISRTTSISENMIQLKDGRLLGYAELGILDGKALFYFHGHPGCRLEAKFLTEVAEDSNVHLIGIDRPGMGYSTFKASRSLLDWTDDVVELADFLKIDQFAVVGFSGGGPYAAACAYMIPDRLTACGIIAGVGKINPFLSFLSKWLPLLLLPITKRLFRDEAHARSSLIRFSKNWPDPDRKSLLIPGIIELMAASIVEALHQGSKGPAYDGKLLGSPWGFNLEDITFGKLYLWHGEVDKEIPIRIGRAIAEKLANCKATFYPNEGHISLIVNRREEIMTTFFS